MENVKVEYINEDSKVLFEETIPYYKVPRKDDVLYWHRSSFKVSCIERHFEENKIAVLVETL